MPFIDELRAEEQVLEEVATEPTESDGTFLSTLRAEETEEASQADHSLFLTEQLQPEHEAKVYDLSKRTGYDVPTVRTDPAKVEKQANSYVPGANEKLDRYYSHSLVEGQPNTAISADDWEPLLKVHDTVDKNKGVLKRNLERLSSERISLTGLLKTDAAALAAGAMNIPRQFGNLMDFVAPLIVDKRKLDYADKILEKITISRDVQDWLRSKYGDTLLEQWTAGAMESFGQMAAVAATGGTGTVLYSMAATSGIERATETEAEGVDKMTATMLGIEAAVVEYWTEKIPLDEMLGPGKKFIRKLLVGGVTDMAGELLATTNEIYVNQSVLGKRFTKDEIKQALLDTVMVSWIMTAGGTTATHPFVKNRDIDLSETKAQTQLIEKDKAFHESIDEERAVIKETKTNERSKDHMKEVLKSLDKTEDVYIASEGIKTLLQSQSEQAATAILQKVNVGLPRAQEAMRAGQDIPVNVADILTLEDDDYNLLKQDIKEAPGAYTQRDLSENIAKEDTENVSKRIQEIESEQKPVDEEIARITKEQNDRAQKEQKKLAKELDIETGRIEAEVDAARLPETKLAKDAATILRGIAERLQLFGIDPVQRLKNITVKRTPIQEFIAKGKSLFQTDKEVNIVESIQKEIIDYISQLITEDDTARYDYYGLRMIYDDSLQEGDIHPTSFHFIDGESTGEEIGGVSVIGVNVDKLKESVAEMLPYMKQYPGLRLALLSGGLKEYGQDKFEIVLDEKDAKILKIYNKEETQKFVDSVEWVFQSQKGTPTETGITGTERGAVVFNNERRVIHLFEKADLSTVLHEVGHIALLEYSALEKSPDAPQEFKDDMRVIREWVGAKEGEALTRDQSEQFARGFEAYLLEGKAPTSALRAAFERFKNYLRSIYQSAKDLNVELNDEVRAVFDRMLGTNLEVELAARTGGFVAKTDTEMNALGMNDADKKYAKRLISRTLEKANELLSKDRNESYRENRARFFKEASREIRRENPVYDTIDKIIKEENQMDRDDFLVDNKISDLPNRKLIKKNGMNIDSVARLYGFDDAVTMLDTFSKTERIQEAIKRRVEQKQREHDAQFRAEDYFADITAYRDYQELMGRYIGGATVSEADIDAGIQRNIKRWETEAKEQNPDATPQELTDIVQDKIDEYRQKQLKPKAVARDTLKRLAKETIEAKTVSEAQQVHKFLAAMKRAANDERRAILRKDWGAAARANELGRFNYEMASLSKNIKDEVNKDIKNAKRIGKLKAKETIDNAHKEAILHLIDRFRLADMRQRNPEVAPDFNALFAEDDFGRPGFPGLEFLNTGIRDYRNLRLEQFRELDKAIRFLEGRGRVDKVKTLQDGFTLVEDVSNEASDTLEKLKPRKQYEAGSMMRKLSDFYDDKFAWLDSLEFTIKSADGYVNIGKNAVKGLLERTILDPIKRGLDRITVDQKRIQAELQPHLDQIQKTNRAWRKKFGRHIKIEGVDMPAALLANKQTKGFFDYQIWAIALNTGNKGETGNYENLKSGYGLTDGDINLILNIMSVDDMRAVQGIWDVINSLYPQADAQFLKDNNYHLSKIDATPFTFKGETFAGGYYPIAHDKALSRKAKIRQATDDFFDKEDAPLVVPFTRKGSTIDRVKGVSIPLRLDFSVMDGHFRDVLHYVHLTDAIRDADRVTMDDRFREVFVKVLGEKVYDNIRPALKHIANPKKAGIDIIGNQEVDIMRGLSTAYVLAWNTGVALKQPLSTFSAIHDMGVKAYMKGFSSTILSPVAHYQKMIDLSPRMRERLSSFDRELKSAFMKLTAEQRGVYFGDTKVTWQDVRNFGFWQIRLADTATVLPIWHGAFESKLKADQSNMQEAIEYADNTVDKSQPSARPLDLSRWQRDASALKLFSQFQTFTVGKYGQRQRYHYRAWKQGAISTVDYAWFNFMDAVLPLVTINFMMALLQGRDLGDEEEQKEMMIDIILGWGLMGVPILGNIARSLTTGWGDPFDSPVLETGNKFIRGLYSGSKALDGFDNDKEREKALWGIANVVSILSGVPLDKIVARAQKGAEQKKGAPIIKYLIPAHK